MDSQATVGITGPVTAGLVIIALCFGGFGGWAALAPLESAAIAQGVVSVESNRKTVQHLEGGIIQEILVRDGDVVVLDQLLVRLDDTQPRALLDLLHGRRNAAAALAARLSAERRLAYGSAADPTLLTPPGGHLAPLDRAGLLARAERFLVPVWGAGPTRSLIDDALAPCGAAVAGA